MDTRFVLFFAVLGIVNCQSDSLSCDTVKKIVDGHNSLRLHVAKGELEGQPAAEDMKLMMWDQELADKAQNWASKNEYGLNTDRTVESGRFETGENLLQFYTPDENFEFDPAVAMEAWFKQHEKYQYGPMKADAEDNTGVYTQMVWANSKYIGCGYSKYKKEDLTNFFVVCNYGPAGNVVGETPYKTKADGNGTLICDDGNCGPPYGEACNSAE